MCKLMGNLLAWTNFIFHNFKFKIYDDFFIAVVGMQCTHFSFLFLGHKASKRNFFVIKSFFFLLLSVLNSYAYLLIVKRKGVKILIKKQRAIHLFMLELIIILYLKFSHFFCSTILHVRFFDFEFFFFNFYISQ